MAQTQTDYDRVVALPPLLLTYNPPMTSRPAPIFALLFLLFTAAVAHAQPIRWNMANEYPATSIQGEADARFAREVGERTGGRIQIVHQYDASSGIRSKDMVTAIARGTLPIGNTFMGALGAVEPVFVLPSLPVPGLVAGGGTGPGGGGAAGLRARAGAPQSAAALPLAVAGGGAVGEEAHRQRGGAQGLAGAHV